MNVCARWLKSDSCASRKISLFKTFVIASGRAHRKKSLSITRFQQITRFQKHMNPILVLLLCRPLNWNMHSQSKNGVIFIYNDLIRWKFWSKWHPLVSVHTHAPQNFTFEVTKAAFWDLASTWPWSLRLIYNDLIGLKRINNLL